MNNINLIFSDYEFEEEKNSHNTNHILIKMIKDKIESFKEIYIKELIKKKQEKISKLEKDIKILSS